MYMKPGIFCFLILSSLSSPAQNPIELGDVHWFRDLSTAQAQSKLRGKPIFILFQEIPGCSTCQRYGSQVLSHPLIVEAIETEFIPLAIHNNKGGEDSRVLKLFNEPAWNNPVVRIVDDQLRNIISRLDGDYSPKGVTSYMIKALQTSKKKVPAYLQLLNTSFTNTTQQLTFGMYCFWEGEKRLGNLEGVTCTQPGFVGGHEVVQVTFDPESISEEKLMAEAQRQECAAQVYTNSVERTIRTGANMNLKPMNGFKVDKEPQYYLMHTEYKYVPMLPIQASRINSAIAYGQDPVVFLSKNQLDLLAHFKSHPKTGDPKAYQNDLVAVWKKNVLQMSRR